MMEGYREDLAHIHDAGYGAPARHAAAVLLDGMRRSGLSSGLVVDFGCGSGILAREVADAGYDVLGIDQSAALLARARSRVPAGEFRHESVWAARIPACVAVAAVGEVLNYRFDGGNTQAALARLLRRVHSALVPGGVFLLDVAGPGSAPHEAPRRGHNEGDGWVVLVTAQSDPRQRVLTRRITSFRQVGDGLYRRDDEVHRLRLILRPEVARQLREAGFRVRALSAYGALPFLPGRFGFLARKP
jgi:SAM-dependent methyltransferase